MTMKLLRTLRRRFLPWSEAPSARDVRGEAVILVFLDDEKIGSLRKEGETFVFKYDDEYARSPTAVAIPAFPDLQKEYRAERLWPFFGVRLPAVEREDVQRAMRGKDIEDDDVLRLLGELSKRAVSSLYRFGLGH